MVATTILVVVVTETLPLSDPIVVPLVVLVLTALHNTLEVTVAMDLVDH